MKHPEEFQVQKQLSPDNMRAHVANLQLQKDAKELAELCATVPSDMDGVKQGVLPQVNPHHTGKTSGPCLYAALAGMEADEASWGNNLVCVTVGKPARTGLLVKQPAARVFTDSLKIYAARL